MDENGDRPESFSTDELTQLSVRVLREAIEYAYTRLSADVTEGEKIRWAQALARLINALTPIMFKMGVSTSAVEEELREKLAIIPRKYLREAEPVKVSKRHGHG